ncbi:hypothetical protein B0H14DRAFT_2653508 [Mycena olivaceomarginata]|nr:hypothetical protein B0H14DRAFT_2653508 [Mycena olivaceomarginata]
MTIRQAVPSVCPGTRLCAHALYAASVMYSYILARCIGSGTRYPFLLPASPISNGGILVLLLIQWLAALLNLSGSVLRTRLGLSGLEVICMSASVTVLSATLKSEDKDFYGSRLCRSSAVPASSCLRRSGAVRRKDRVAETNRDGSGEREMIAHVINRNTSGGTEKPTETDGSGWWVDKTG